MSSNNVLGCFMGAAFSKDTRKSWRRGLSLKGEAKKAFFWILRFTVRVEGRAPISDIGDGCTVVLVGGVGLKKCRAQLIAPLLNLSGCFYFVGLFGGIHSALRFSGFFDSRHAR